MLRGMAFVRVTVADGKNVRHRPQKSLRKIAQRVLGGWDNADFRRAGVRARLSRTRWPIRLKKLSATRLGDRVFGFNLHQQGLYGHLIAIFNGQRGDYAVKGSGKAMLHFHGF